MKIGIIGGGAIGLLLASYYSSRHEVLLITRRAEQAERIGQKGIKLLSGNAEWENEVHVSSMENGLPDNLDVLFIAVKQYDLEPVIAKLHHIASDALLCFVQNGMGHLKQVETLPQKTIAVATVEHGAARTDDRTVRHNGIGKLNVALLRGKSDLPLIFPKADSPDFPVDFHSDYEEMLLRKLAANAVINPLTAAMKVKNGQLLSNPHYHFLFHSLYEEVASVFPKLGHPRYLQEIEAICQNTKENTSSMLKDLLEGRETEVDAILGFIMEEAKFKGIDVPSIRFVYRMIKGMEGEGGKDVG